MWPIILSALYLLGFIGSHPSTVPLSRPGMEIGVKDGDQFTFVVFYLISFYVSMVFVYVLCLFKMQSIQFFSNSENAADYVFQFKIGLQFLIIEIEAFLF